MSTQDTESDDGTGEVTERWTFGGVRFDSGKRVHAWIDPKGSELWFKARGSYSVGGLYYAQVIRKADGRITLVSTPRYTGDSTDDDALRDRLSASHRAAELAAKLKARERAAQKDDPLEVAVDRVADLVARAPASQRAALAVYVTTRLLRQR